MFLNFSFQVGILLKGTSDDDSPIPGYLFKEIAGKLCLLILCFIWNKEIKYDKRVHDAMVKLTRLAKRKTDILDKIGGAVYQKRESLVKVDRTCTYQFLYNSHS